MVDVHSHILPCIDDGASSIKESLALLELLKMQGITHVFATPHFEATEDNTIDDFLQRRNNSYLKLTNAIKENKLELPKILLGAEVLLTTSLSEIDDISRLCYQNTSRILIEMPYNTWKTWTFDLLFTICSKNFISPIIAHIDRYIGVQSKENIEKLMQMNLDMQIDADAFNGFTRRRKISKVLDSGSVKYIGSDCHNIKKRPPTFDDFHKKYVRIVGEDFFKYVEKNSNQLVSDK